MAKPDTEHREYAEHRAQWDKCRDAIDGEDAVHEAGVKYLPRLKGQSEEDYKAYVTRTPLYNAVGRTIDGLTGMVFRKAPAITVPAAIQPFVDDMTLTNCDLPEFAEILTRETISIGRIGVLVEYPQIIEQPVSLAQATAQNLRPYCTVYKSECIKNWRVVRVNNVVQPVMIALEEYVTEYANEYESKEIEQYRSLLLIDGVYIQRIYRKNENTKEWEQFGEDIVPLMQGKPLDYIPFVFFGANSNSQEISTPPLYDLVTLNLSHYRTSADLEHGSHFTGLPTAVVSGYTPATNDKGVVTEKLSIGSSTAWIFPQPEARATYLEFTGQGLGALEKLKKEKELAMASLGARMLAPEKTGVEAQGTVRMRHSGETAVLSSIVNMLDAGLTRILMIMAQWQNVQGEISIKLNKDFIESSLTAQEILAYVQSWQAGVLPKEELFWNLKQGEVIRPETTYDEYFGMLETAIPALA